VNIRTFKSIIGNVYQVVIETQDWSELDNELMASYGEPEIDLGGSFTGPPAFDLPNDLVRIKSGSPFVEKFDGDDFGDAEDRATVWADEVVVRLKDAIDTLRSNSDDFTGENVEQY
jgi:hypothetical protein